MDVILSAIPDLLPSSATHDLEIIALLAGWYNAVPISALHGSAVVEDPNSKGKIGLVVRQGFCEACSESLAHEFFLLLVCDVVGFAGRYVVVS